MKSRLAVGSAIILCLLISSAPGSTTRANPNWHATPIMAHEWGVSTFVWSRGDKHPPARLPRFFYTSERPGKPLNGSLAVRDFPPDHRSEKLRKQIEKLRSNVFDKWYWKPVLYFYMHGPGRTAPIGLHVGFPRGRAAAWYPQVDVYRSGGPIRKFHKVHGDDSSQLIWKRLSLHRDTPGSSRSLSRLAPNEKWVAAARQVDSALVSNGKEREKFVFYEGASREVPFIALIPQGGPGGSVVNIGDYPIHDVFVIYRKPGSRRVWSTYLPTLPSVARIPAVPRRGHAVPSITVLPLPDLLSSDSGSFMNKKQFAEKMGRRLIQVLSSGAKIGSGTMYREPSRAQPRTESHFLYPKEAAALEKIWRDDLFKNDGLTIIYREDPRYLDKIMPLRIYTDRTHYIMLSRCGLVLNRNIPFRNLPALYKNLKKPRLSKMHFRNRYLSLGLVEFMSRRRMGPPARLRDFKKILRGATEKQ